MENIRHQISPVENSYKSFDVHEEIAHKSEALNGSDLKNYILYPDSTVIQSASLKNEFGTCAPEMQSEVSLRENEIVFEKTPSNPSNTSIRKLNSSAPTKIPVLAWALLFIGVALLAAAIVFGIIFLVLSGSLIGAPLYFGLMVIAGILFLVLATQTAMAPLNHQPNPPNTRYQKEAPKREKEPREPLKKGDKIFMAIMAGLLLIIGISLLSY